MTWEKPQLSEKHANVIRATLPLVGQHINEITSLFYKTMFQNHPELIKDLFNRGNQKQGAQQKALAASVAVFASKLVSENEGLPAHLFSRIGHKHAALGITADQYQIVHDNLFYAIVQVLGADTVTAEVAEAWDRVYWLMADMLIKFEKGLYDEAGVEPGKVFRQVKVVQSDKLTDDVTLFSIESTDASKPLPAHKPGQYISVRARLPDGAGQLRQYSLVDDGVKAGRLSFAVKAVSATESAPAGEVSNWLSENARVGTELEVSLPFGDLVLDTASSAPVVLVSAGIGATPMMGMLSRLVHDKSERQIIVLHVDKSAATDAFASQAKQLVSKLSNCRFHSWYAEGTSDDTTTIGEKLNLGKESLPKDALVYLCGSTEFLQAAAKDLKETGIPEDNVQFELFTPNDWLIS